MEKVDNFDWGPLENNPIVPQLKEEIFNNKIYETILPVETGDVVVDVGASIGLFGYSIKDKNISKLICVEPSRECTPTLIKNLKDSYFEVVLFNGGISNKYEHKNIKYLNPVSIDGQYDGEFECITLKQLFNTYNLNKIDFLKTDCEGGEYDIFDTLDNALWVKHNVKKIVGEWHLSTPQLIEKFRNFRDNYLDILFNKFEVRSIDGVDIKWDLYNEHFLEYYNEVIIHIDNR